MYRYNICILLLLYVHNKDVIDTIKSNARALNKRAIEIAIGLCRSGQCTVIFTTNNGQASTMAGRLSGWLGTGLR